MSRMYDGLEQEWFSQEQEQYDYEMGMGTELQNAFVISQMNREPDDSQIIRELQIVGRYVLFSEYPVNCPHTDATLGFDKTYIADFETRAEAVAMATSKPDYELEWLCIAEPFCEPKLIKEIVINHDDIPF